MDNLYNIVDENIRLISSTPFSNKKFKLKKNKSREITIISKPQTNHIKLNKEDINKIRNKVLGNELIKFRKKLYKNFKSENLNLLNNNIKTLKVKIKYFAPEILLMRFASGKYKLKQNRIELIKYFKEGSTNHEFFHMATSFYDKKLKIGFCGFQQLIYFKEETVGYGLNEGYTELLTDRYFNEQIDFRAYSYDVCTFFASKLEEIVEKDRMESFYMTADLYGLYKYLLNFDDGENIVTFIKAIDSLLREVSMFNSKKYQNHYELIECYLAKWYISKKKQELDKNIIDKNTFDIEIKNYIDSLSNEELYLENYVRKRQSSLRLQKTRFWKELVKENKK